MSQFHPRNVNKPEVSNTLTNLDCYHCPLTLNQPHHPCKKLSADQQSPLALSSPQVLATINLVSCFYRSVSTSQTFLYIPVAQNVRN